MATLTFDDQVVAQEEALVAGHGSASAGRPGAHEYRALFMRYRRDHDRAARDELFARFAPFADGLARRYRHTSEPYQDLCQVAQLGLVKAIDRFDPERGFSFTSYAAPTILGELRRYFRDCSWSVHVPRGSQERALEVRNAERTLSELHGRSPSVSELTEFMSLTTEQVLDALHALRSLRSLSLDAPRGSENDDEDGSYVDTIGSEDSRFELVEQGADVKRALRMLKPQQREILRLRFFENMTQSQIGEQIGISQMQVSRLLGRCMAELRELVQATAETAEA